MLACGRGQRGWDAAKEQGLRRVVKREMWCAQGHRGLGTRGQGLGPQKRDGGLPEAGSGVSLACFCHFSHLLFPCGSKQTWSSWELPADSASVRAKPGGWGPPASPHPALPWEPRLSKQAHGDTTWLPFPSDLLKSSPRIREKPSLCKEG